jgi:hypothetical protein
VGVKLFSRQEKSFPLLMKVLAIHVPDGKGQGQPACQKEWKKCEEENE